jgi:hypothetical protein
MAQSTKVFAGSTLTPSGDAAISGNALLVAAAASYDENFQSYSVGDTPTGWTDKASATFRVALNGATKVGRMTHASWGAAQHDGPFGQGCFVADLLTSSGAGSSQSSHVVRFVNGSASGHLRQVIRSAADTLYLDIPANYIGHNAGARMSSFPIPGVPDVYKTNTGDLTGQQVVSVFRGSTLLGMALLTAAAKYQGNSVCLHGINGTTDYTRLRFFPTKTGGFTSAVLSPYSVSSVTRIVIEADLDASYVKAPSALFEYRLDGGAWTALPDTGYINAACTTSIEVRANSTLKNNLDASSNLQINAIAVEIDGIWDQYVPPSVSAPTDVAAGSPGNSSVPLTWTDAASPAAFVDIYVATSELGVYSLVEVAVAGEESATVYGLDSDTEYFFKLKSRSAEGATSAFTAAVSATTTVAVVPDPPTAFNGVVVDRGSVQLDWTDEPLAFFYHVEMAVGPGFGTWSPAGLAVQGEGGILLLGLEPETSYRFRVSSENASGLGTTSPVVQLTTPAAPAATALSASAPSQGVLRLAFEDDAAGEAGYIGYIATVNDFAQATQFGFAPAGQEYLEAKDLPAGTQHWLWLVAVDALGFGAASGPATATTMAATVPGQLLVSELRAALRAFVKSAVPSREVIWLYEDGPKPAKGFVGLHLVGPTKPGQDEQLAGQTAGPRTFGLTVRCFNDKQDLALQDAMAIQSAMDRVDLLAPLQAAGYAFGPVGRIQDTSGLLGSKWEARHEFEAEVNASSTLAVSDGEIDTINLGNGLPAEP